MEDINRGSTEALEIDVTDKGEPMPLTGYKALVTLFKKDKTTIALSMEIDPIPNPETCMIVFKPSKTDFDIPIDTYFLEVKIESDTERFFPIKYEQINIV